MSRAWNFGRVCILDDDDVGPNVWEPISNLLHKLQEILMEDEDLILGMLDGIQDNLLSEIRVDRVEHGSGTWDGKVHFEIAMAIPLNDANPCSLLDAELI